MMPRGGGGRGEKGHEPHCMGKENNAQWGEYENTYARAIWTMQTDEISLVGQVKWRAPRDLCYYYLCTRREKK